jgi:hypothetical protein
MRRFLLAALLIPVSALPALSQSGNRRDTGRPAPLLVSRRVLYGLGPGALYLADVESTSAGHQHVLTAADSQPAKLLLEQGLVVVALVAASGFLVSNLTVSMFLLLPLALLSWAA